MNTLQCRWSLNRIVPIFHSLKMPGTGEVTRTLARVALLAAVAVSGLEAFAQRQDEYLLEVGPELTQIYLPTHPIGTVQYQPGVGFTMSARLHKAFAADLGFSITPTIPLTSTTFAGGRLTQALAGARWGLSLGRFEVCGKARPGVVSFGSTILHASSTPSGVQIQMGRLTEPAIDLGGIVIIHAGRRVAFRYEAGDTLIDYRPRRIGTTELQASRVVSTFAFGMAAVFKF